MKTQKIFFFICLVSLSSCVSDKSEGPVISDATLFSLANNATSFTYFKNRTDTLDADPASPHFPYVRVRFNPRAVSSMNDSMNSLAASAFPDESMVVKEIYDVKGGSLQTYAIMYKLHGASNSGSGWIWGEYRADGTVIYSSARKGDQCVSCHSSQGNSDLVRTFALH